MWSFTTLVATTASRYVPYGSASSSTAASSTGPTDISTHVRNRPRNHTLPPERPSSTPSSPTSSASSTAYSASRPSSPTVEFDAKLPKSEPDDHDSDEKYAVIHDILRRDDLYAVLGVTKTCDVNALRRGYMKRCKACHPDKYPSYPLATIAFQKVSFAYDTLSHPSSRRLYDVNGLSSMPRPDGTPDSNYTSRADETLNGVLYGVFCDFMEGDFQMLRTFLRAMNEVNPALNINEDTIESLVGTFSRLRDVLLTGQKYVRVIRFELIRLYEIQHSLRQLSYFDVCGRLRLTLALARVTLSLPCAIDKAMMDEADEEARQRAAGGLPHPPPNSTSKRKGLLHPRVNSVLISVCGVLEYGERVL